MPSPFATSRSQVVSARPDAVMALVRDTTTWPRWQSEIRTAAGPRKVDAGDTVEGTAEMLGFAVNGHSRIKNASDGRLQQDVIVGVYMEVTFVVEEHPGGAVVTHQVRADLPRGPLGWLLSVFLRRRLVRMQRVTLARLARQVED